MAYTRPSASAADASWSGDPTYTRPSAGSAHAAFLESYQAEPLPSGTLGEPTASSSVASSLPSGELGVPSTLLPAEPLPSSILGEPFGYQWWAASSLPPSSFGLAGVVHEALPLPASTIGVPDGYQYYRAGSIPAGSFGTPTTPTDRTGVATPLAASSIGQPMAMATTPTVGVGRLARAEPLPSSAPSDAAAAWDVIAQAESAPAGTLGTPRLSGATGVSYRCYASALPGSTWGEPVGGWDFTGEASAIPAGTIAGAGSILSGDASSLASSAPSDAAATLQQRVAASLTGSFGVPRVGRTQTATSLGPATFGVPRSSQSGTYVPYPLPSSRFGQPTGLSRFEYSADSLPPGTLGEPEAHETHIATSLYSTTEFGIPLLRRDALC